MPNALYTKYREKALQGQINWLTDNIKVVLVDAADYTVNIATHEFLSDVGSSGRVATSANLSGKTATGGVADANDVTFPSVSGDISEALVIYKDTGTDATSPLIAYIDTATGLAVTPNGGDITVIWPNDAGRIFSL
ncbi:hypothetical protein [Mycobacterium intracellulare]|uniref:hypothetical protein n=1 Tax=Mycobacterium intracellulare TaxID=1767 RepID=UPI00080BDEB3|nr:hypothetical protein [Mycobacterium intracellulare]OCB15070.1 hypothetical protein A5689_26810 [Mycobacterium intracellulare subsp. yongonense]